MFAIDTSLSQPSWLRSQLVVVLWREVWVRGQELGNGRGIKKKFNVPFI